MSDGNELIYDLVGRSVDAGLVCTDPSLALQSQAEDADINTIIRRFALSGEVPVNLRAPLYIDYEGVFDFQSAQNVLVSAREEFMRVPAAVRAEFENNPQLFLEAFADPAARPKLERLGLVKTPDVVPVVVPQDGAPTPT